MDLQRKRLSRIKQLGQDGEARAVGNFGPEDRGAFFNPQLMQGPPAPGPLPNDALRFRAVDDFPRFADRLPRRKLLTEKALQPPPAPDPTMT